MRAVIARPSGVGHPKVSVVVTTYNHERYIAQAMEGVLLQKVDFEYEIIVGEDCSTDGTRAIVQEFHRRFPDRIRLILPHANLGAFGNRIFAQALQMARGEYIALLDGDDYWTSPHKLQKQAAFLDSHPGCVICFCNSRYFWDDGSHEPFNINPPDQKEISTLEDLLIGNFMQGSSIMYRGDAVTEAVLAAGADDFEAGVLIAQHGDIGYINEVMVAYRVHSGGVWSGLSPAQQLEWLVGNYERLDPALGFRYHETIKGQLAILYYRLAIEYEKQGDLVKAAAYLRQCIEARSTRLEEYLSWTVGLPGPSTQKILRRRLWLYSHPTVYRLATSCRPLTKEMKRLGMIAGTAEIKRLEFPTGTAPDAA